MLFLWTVICSHSVYMYLHRLFHYSIFNSYILRYSRSTCALLKRAATRLSYSLLCIMGSIILLLFSERNGNHLAAVPSLVDDLTTFIHPLPLRSVTFKGILGKLRPCTMGVAKLCASHKMGLSGGPNMMRDRRTYRTASDIFHINITVGRKFHRTSAHLSPLPQT
jgi:hypothetical protein